MFKISGGGDSDWGMGNPSAPHPLYVTLNKDLDENSLQLPSKVSGVYHVNSSIHKSKTVSWRNLYG